MTRKKIAAAVLGTLAPALAAMLIHVAATTVSLVFGLLAAFFTATTGAALLAMSSPARLPGDEGKARAAPSKKGRATVDTHD